MPGETVLNVVADKRPLAALIAGAICIAFAPIFVRLVDVGVTAAAFWRTMLALPLLWVLWYPRRQPPSPESRARIRWLVLAGALFAADLAAWHQSIRFTSVANATLLANLAPVFVTGAAVWLFGERINLRFLGGLLLALAGSFVLVANSFGISMQTVMGDVLGITAAVFYSGYLLGVSRMRRSASAVEVMWWSTLACTVVLLPLTLLLGERLFPQSLHGWALLIGLALISHVAGQGLIAWALAHLSPAFSSVSLLLQPVAAAMLAWVILSEPFGAQQALGGAIVLAGIVSCRLAMLKK